jgi:hypothetical protein
VFEKEKRILTKQPANAPMYIFSDNPWGLELVEQLGGTDKVNWHYQLP